MELEDIRGLGPKRADLLREAGIKTVKDLAEADLRRVGPIEGVGSDAFQKHKAAARRLLDRKGIPYARSPYGTGASRTRSAPRAAAPRAPAPTPPKEPAPTEAPRKRGLLRRLFG